MPELDYVLLADYVRQDASGTVHIMAAGLDTFTVRAAALPTAMPVGIAARVTFSAQDEVGALNQLNLVYSGPPGDLLTASQQFPTPPPVPGVPQHWRTAVGVAIRLLLPMPVHGNYSLQVMLNDDPRLSHTLDLRAIEPGS